MIIAAAAAAAAASTAAVVDAISFFPIPIKSQVYIQFSTHVVHTFDCIFRVDSILFVVKIVHLMLGTATATANAVCLSLLAHTHRLRIDLRVSINR